MKCTGGNPANFTQHTRLLCSSYSLTNLLDFWLAMTSPSTSENKEYYIIKVLTSNSLTSDYFSLTTNHFQHLSIYFLRQGRTRIRLSRLRNVLPMTRIRYTNCKLLQIRTGEMFETPALYMLFRFSTKYFASVNLKLMGMAHGAYFLSYCNITVCIQKHNCIQ